MIRSIWNSVGNGEATYASQSVAVPVELANSELLIGVFIILAKETPANSAKNVVGVANGLGHVPCRFRLEGSGRARQQHPHSPVLCLPRALPALVHSSGKLELHNGEKVATSLRKVSFRSPFFSLVKYHSPGYVLYPWLFWQAHPAAG